MDEVDKIILHSLNQIGCCIDNDCTIENFTPSLLVHAVSCCLQEIQPETPNLPLTLPEVLPMAQRFSVATTLASLVSSLNYRNDIGYQTFLYPNVVEVRRLLMFLIEQLPRESQQTSPTDVNILGDYGVWRENVKAKIFHQLHAPWVPNYCRGVGNKRYNACSSQRVKFSPHHNLNIGSVNIMQEQTNSTLPYQAPSIFQQTAAQKFDLISSVLHKNAIDVYKSVVDEHTIPRAFISGSQELNITDKTNETTETRDETSNNLLSPLEKLTQTLNTLKIENDELLHKRKTVNAKISDFKIRQSTVQTELEQLCKDAKIHERTCVILENPDNVVKLRSLIQTTQDRRKILQQQWQEYRQPMLTNLESLKAEKQMKNMQNVKELRATISVLQQALHEKENTQSILAAELKSAMNGKAAPRKEYINRIMEFIGNIRKQRNDIYKVLDDTRDLQKQINSISAQLQRQFSYTDDLLFQTAKHDVHAKQAYKLLATVHGTCTELVELVSKTGGVTNSIRELELQIDREKLKNIATSFQQISGDIRNFENVIYNIQSEIHKIENEIKQE